MALQKHQNVNFSDDPTLNADGLMTLEHEKNPQRQPVYFCEMPFLLDSTTVREIIGNAATRSPQGVSAFIDTAAHELQPDLMLSVQAYCVHNDDVIKLESIEIISESGVPELNEISLIIGSDALLQQCLQETAPSGDKTIVYFPTHIQDQLKLHELLDVDPGHSVVPIVSSVVQRCSPDQPYGISLINAIELAIAQDAELFRWIEANATELANQQSDALSHLVKQYCSSASVHSPAFLSEDAIALSKIDELSDSSLYPDDAAAILLMIKTQVSVEVGLLPDGANIRVWHLLSTLGHQLYFDKLAEKASSESAQLFGQSPRTLLNSIGELSPMQTLEPKHIEAAMLWLEEQNR